MSATPSPLPAITAEAFLAWSEQQRGCERHELLDGRIVQMGPERVVHARTKYAVTRCLERAIVDAELPCEALVDGMAVRVDHQTVFEPDVLVHYGPSLADDAIVSPTRSSSSRWHRRRRSESTRS